MRVEELRATERRREFFDGKRVLEMFFRKHLHDTGMSKEIFVYSCGKQASARQSVSSFVEALFATLGIAPDTPVP